MIEKIDIEHIEQQAIYDACMYYVSNFPSEFKGWQIVDAIRNKSDCVMLWDAVEDIDADELVMMIDSLAKQFVEYATKYNNKKIFTQKDAK
jgi:hypothetical protein